MDREHEQWRAERAKAKALKRSKIRKRNPGRRYVRETLQRRWRWLKRGSLPHQPKRKEIAP